MIIFLHGPDEYRRLKKKQEIFGEFTKKHAGGSIGHFDAADKDEIIRLRDFIRANSLFDPKKLAIVENAFSAADGKALSAVIKESAKSENTTVLMSEKNKTNDDMPFLSRKSESIKMQDFPWLTGTKWKSFISENAKENGVTLKADALDFLSDVYSGDTWGLVTEMGKLAGIEKTHSIGSGREAVSLEDLKALGLETGDDFFGLLNGLKSQNMANRTASLEALFSTNEPMPKVFNIIAYQIPDKLGMMAKYDVLVKSGKLEYEEVLVDLVI